MPFRPKDNASTVNYLRDYRFLLHFDLNPFYFSCQKSPYAERGSGTNDAERGSGTNGAERGSGANDAEKAERGLGTNDAERGSVTNGAERAERG